MRGSLKFLTALVVAFVVMLAFRALVMTVCTVEGDGLAPGYMAGDHIVINRWSYGLRTGEKGSLFDYGRLCRQDIEKGDFIAFEDSLGKMFICRCSALPGDTVALSSYSGRAVLGSVVVPGLVTCADQDYYWVEPIGKKNQLSSQQLGFIPEHRIIGRVCLILYSHDPAAPFWKGFRSERLLLPQ